MHDGKASDDRSIADIFKGWESAYHFVLGRLVSVPVDPAFGLHIVDRGLRILHTIPIFRERRIFRRRFLEHAPTNSNIHKFIASIPLSASDSHVDTFQSRKSVWNGLPVNNVIKYLDASRYVRRLDKMPEARVAFQELEVGISPNPETLRGASHGSDWNYESLRRSRVNLDATCCMLFRRYWLALPFTSMFIYLFIDSSPQWRGLELFAASFDMCVGHVAKFCERRLFVQVGIGKHPSILH
jgi:hypothetical protein